MKILCHVGPWCREQLESLARALDAGAEIRYASGYRRLDETGLVSDYYSYVRSGEAAFEEEDDREVIARCRLLRSLDPADAARHLGALRRALREMLLREQPDLLVCETIDQFLIDLLFREAARLEIPAFGMVQSFVNGYFRISIRGERWQVRTADPVEVEEVLEKLIDRNYLPVFVQSSRRNPTLAYWKVFAANHLRVWYFWARRYLSGEPFNFHYWSSWRNTVQLHRHFIPARKLGDRNWRDRLASTGKPVLFVPLQHFPEATIDYWAEDILWVDYPAKLPEMLRKLEQHFTVVVKEHPAVWGWRLPKFYEALRSIPGLIFCPTETLSQEGVEICDAVLVWTGSVGFEAALRGKAVLSPCNPYYASGNRFMQITMDTPGETIEAFVNRVRSEPITREEQRELVGYLLAGLLPGKFRVDGSFSPANPQHVEEAQIVGRWLRRVYDAGRAGIEPTAHVPGPALQV